MKELAPSAGAAPVETPWTVEAGAVAEALGADPTRGLSAADAAGRLERYGPNELHRAVQRSAWARLASQFRSSVIVLLFAAAAVSLAIGEVTDAVVILAIVVLNAVLGYVQEGKAEQAIEALQALTAERATVVRDGRPATVASRDVVPGDVVLLAAGDMVPADLRLSEAAALTMNEAPLTGESEPAAKITAPLPDVPASQVADQRNTAFKGTAVTAGRGRGLVVATGTATQFGQISTMLERAGSDDTPLQKRLAVLGRWLAAAAVAICVVVFVAGVASGEDTVDMLLTAVSLAVAAVPEGLPAVVTVALALGARRMAERRALIRRLPAVETLGSVTVICTDKTGTLTENRMVVERVWTPRGEHQVSGSGYDPHGDVAGARADPFVTRAATVAAQCNDAHLDRQADGTWAVVGDPTEGALLTFAAKAGVERGETRSAEVPFTAERRRMTTAQPTGGGGFLVTTKGALGEVGDALADRSVLADAETVADRWAADGYRVIALADRHVEHLPEDPEALETDLELVGLVALADPPRPEAAQAVAECRTAGIVPVVITGDHPTTAAAIARRIGIIEGDGDPGAVLTGTELERLDDAEFRRRVEHVRLYARTNPAQKLRIVEAWRDDGAIVAMTGDGVNDAPALRRADIGVAMGGIGTEVSREASDMVLADDNFATIVNAVEEGRRIFDNVRRFLRYLLTTNAGEVFVMFIAIMVGLPVPLTPVQILWVNLITDGLPAIALGVEPADPDAMHRPPRPPDESILARGLWQHALWVGLLMAAIVLPMQALSREADWPWPTMVFTTVAFLQLGHALAVRSETRSFFTMGPMSNPWLLGAVLGTGLIQLAVVYVPFLQDIFGTEALDPRQLGIVLAASTLVFFAVEIEKAIRRRRHDPALTAR